MHSNLMNIVCVLSAVCHRLIFSAQPLILKADDSTFVKRLSNCIVSYASDSDTSLTVN